VFEGLVIRIRGHKGLKSFTVRKLSSGVGVEKIFPENSPTVTAIEVTKKGSVRRAVLSYLRNRVGKKATKVKDKFVKGVKDIQQEVVVKDSETLTEEQRQATKLARMAAEEKAAKAASKLEKAAKKAKKKHKIERKERTFVR
jgi:dsDNA-specific endonuclease/ATPase MutS2